MFTTQLILGLLVSTLGVNLEETVKQAPEAAQRVVLVVHYGDGVEKQFTALNWKSGMTVLDVLEAARKHPRGIRFKYRGSGKRAFLTQIDDVENEGKGNNWIFRVNKKLGEESFAVTAVNAGDVILWEFGKYK